MSEIFSRFMAQVCGFTENALRWNIALPWKFFNHKNFFQVLWVLITKYKLEWFLFTGPFDLAQGQSLYIKHKNLYGPVRLCCDGIIQMIPMWLFLKTCEIQDYYKPLRLNQFPMQGC